MFLSFEGKDLDLIGKVNEEKLRGIDMAKVHFAQLLKHA